SEEANTLTLGIVADVTDRTTLTVDYWNIEIKDMVSVESVDGLAEQCFSPVTNPTFDPNHASCARLDRNPIDGTQAPYFVTYTNEAAIDTAGVDVALDWSGDVGPGQLGINFLASILDR